jgi:hypothetical protein
VDMLRQASQWFFNEETLKAANKILVAYHYHLPLAVLWGTGQRSSSDRQRFRLRQSSLLGAFYPRYFGYLRPSALRVLSSLRPTQRILQPGDLLPQARIALMNATSVCSCT